MLPGEREKGKWTPRSDRQTSVIPHGYAENRPPGSSAADWDPAEPWAHPPEPICSAVLEGECITNSSSLGQSVPAPQTQLLLNGQHKTRGPGM